MATITLYKDKLNGVGGLIDNIVKSSNNLETQLGTLKSALQGVNSSTYDLHDTVNSISSSSKTEKEKVSDLKKLNKQVTKFITTTVNRDNSVRDEINKSKKDFYSQYSYLKPECEKNAIEKIVDKVEQAAEWCAKHWKLIATAVIVVVAIALIATGVGAGIGGPLLVGACWGAITGAVIGGVAGGLESMSQGGSFLDGFENGAFSGAVGGAIGGAAFAGLGAAGAALGKGISCASKLGSIIKGTAAVSKVLSLGMAGFDLISLADMAIDGKNNPIADLNKKLHSNKAYNIFQGSVSALAVFTSGMTTTMKCFVAGTLILTAEGLKRIEEIKVGDRVLSADTETMISEYKTVLETFVRRTNEIIHIFIENEEITTTVDHPFWVNGKGFVPAMNLVIGSELINDKGDIVCVENVRRETNRDGVEVFNFKVEDFHTYYVGENGILVHNANCRLISNSDGTYDIEMKNKKGWSEEQKTQARQKCEYLSKADTVKTTVPKRSGTKTSKYRKDNSIPSNQDIDHKIDLQLKGKDNADNMWGLDRSVNRSLGKQIDILIHDLEDGTVLRNFYMVD